MNAIAKITALTITGLALGTIVWAWLTYGGDVVLAYAAGVAMSCF